MPWKIAVGNASIPDLRNRDTNRRNFILSAFIDMRRLIALGSCETPGNNSTEGRDSLNG